MVSIVRFPGTNCEYDMHYVYTQLLHIPSAIIWHKERALPHETTLVVLAGGFSYGDYLRSGAIACFSPIMNAICAFAGHGGRILGICNGFQILTEAKLLPGALLRNKHLTFLSTSTPLRIINNNNALLARYPHNATISLPIAHADGRYHADPHTLESLEENNQILLRYIHNHNGSVHAIAGICNKEKTIFGLMPHPERACLPFCLKREQALAHQHSYIYATSSSKLSHAASMHNSSSSMQSSVPIGIAMLDSLYRD